MGDCGHDGGRIVFAGVPAVRVAARATLTGEHLTAYVYTTSRLPSTLGNPGKPARSPTA